jgi:hypothetical protein
MFFSTHFIVPLFFILLLPLSSLAAPVIDTLLLNTRQDPSIILNVNSLIADLSNSSNQITVRVGRIVEVSKDPSVRAPRQSISGICDEIFEIALPTGSLRRQLVASTQGSSNRDDAAFANLEISRHGVTNTDDKSMDVTPDTVGITDNNFFGKIKALEGTPDADVNFARLSDVGFTNTILEMGIIW